MSPPPARMTANARLQPPDWCHFTQRLQRSRAHKQVKGAELPFEDEKFAYVALTRAAVAAAPLSRAGAAGCQQGRGNGKALHAGRSRHHKGAAPRQGGLCRRPALALGRCGGLTCHSGMVREDQTSDAVHRPGMTAASDELIPPHFRLTPCPKSAPSCGGLPRATFSSSFPASSSHRSCLSCRPAGSFSASSSLSCCSPSARITAWSRSASASARPLPTSTCSSSSATI